MVKPALLQRLLKKSLGTIAFRGQQEVRLKAMALTRGWQALESRIACWATPARAADWLKNAPMAVFAVDGAAALRQAAAEGLVNGPRHIAVGAAVMGRDFAIFETPIPKSGSWPWHQDWRFGHEWTPAYFRSYLHSSPRSQPYDVKFPWEISRLGFLTSLVQADILDGGKARTAAACRILKDWRDSNPLAHSVNWYPMEGAMRGIGLCLLADMARQAGIDDDEAALILRLLVEHGEFVMRTLELTDNAGNHFTAELVALLLIGRTLRGLYPRGQHWRRFAEKRLGRELMRQFLPDGVNFEKSTAYHRLVFDLFLLASIALARSDRPFNEAERSRLQAAAHYNAMFLRPDHLCPLIGDSDDAVAFPYEHRHVRDHRPGLGIAALHLKDVGLKAAAGDLPLSGPWLFGHEGLKQWQAMPETASPANVCRFFAEGGVFIAKSERHYLFLDIGEVGQNGLGGHGHNDLLSFELFLNGRPFAVDPGSYLYSGDYAAHDRFRSTRAHNSLVVDEKEIAPLTGYFRIANSAFPLDVKVNVAAEGVAMVTAGHSGYHTLPDPVTHRRTLRFDLHTGALSCGDRIEAHAGHRTTRFLHFAPGIEPVLGEKEAQVDTENGTIIVRWGAQSRARLENDYVSPGFGRLEPSKTLVILDDLEGPATLTLDIYPLQTDSLKVDVGSQ